MTLIRGGLFLIALIGIIAPFELANYLLSKWYPILVTGLPVPLSASIPMYATATLIACIVIVVCYKLIKHDREPTDKQDGLDDSEEVLY